METQEIIKEAIGEYTGLKYTCNRIGQIQLLRNSFTKTIPQIKAELEELDKIVNLGYFQVIKEKVQRGERCFEIIGSNITNKTIDDLRHYKYIGLIEYEYIDYAEDNAEKKRVEFKAKFDKATEWVATLKDEEKEMINILIKGNQLIVSG